MRDLSSVRKLILVVKSHLDLGFTDFASRIARRYFTEYIPRVIDVAEELAQNPSGPQLVWTTGSWLVHEGLQWMDEMNRMRFEIAIRKGHIRWHAMPFTLHSELADRSLFEYGLTLSKELDQRFDKLTRAAKMTDVPGHTRGIIGPMADHGVRFLHIGVNPSSSAPDVPDIFRWRNAKDQEIIVAYAKGDYGDVIWKPGMTAALAFCHAGDNCLPPNAAEVVAEFEKWKKRYPQADIVAGSLEDIVPAIEAVSESLPVIRSEIGDTWIHGVGTDPAKVRKLQLLMHIRRDQLRRHPALARNPAFRRFSKLLLCVVEHTWGLDTKMWPNPHSRSCRQLGHYERTIFETERHSGLYLEWETSWQEQRNYLQAAVESLAGLPFAQKASAAICLELTVAPPRESKEKSRKTPLIFTWNQQNFTIDPKTGALLLAANSQARSPLKDWSQLGRFSYQIFDAKDYERWFQTYNVKHQEVEFWARPDFTKLGLEKVKGLKAKRWFGALKEWRLNQNSGCLDLSLNLVLPKEAHHRFGAPKEICIDWKFNSDKKRLIASVFWQDKPACRLPEAAWFSFLALPNALSGLRLLKLGEEIDPADTVSGGNHRLHAAESARSGGVVIETLGVPLVSPSEPTLLNFTREPLSLWSGLHYNLVNNVWGTNFPMWNEGAARFDFKLKLAN